MKISSRGRYGLKAMVDIAAQCSCENCSCQSSDNDSICTCTCVSLKSIAERQGISEHYLEQLVSPLKKAGLVKSVRGAKGGYTINKSPKDITVGEILRALEGSLCPVKCLEDSENCHCGNANCTECVTKPVWGRIYEGFINVVDSIVLQELVNDYKNKTSSNCCEGE